MATKDKSKPYSQSLRSSLAGKATPTAFRIAHVDFGAEIEYRWYVEDDFLVADAMTPIFDASIRSGLTLADRTRPSEAEFKLLDNIVRATAVFRLQELASSGKLFETLRKHGFEPVERLLGSDIMIDRDGNTGVRSVQLYANLSKEG